MDAAERRSAVNGNARPPSLISNASSSEDSAHVVTPPDSHSTLMLNMSTLSKALDRVAQPPLYLCEPFVFNALVNGKFKVITQCPAYVDRLEWIAVNCWYLTLQDVIDFWAQLNNMYSIVYSICKCESMSVSPNFDLFWRDQRQRPAFSYVDSTLSWVENLSKNKTVFPTEAGRQFAPEFESIASRIYIQLLMLFAHIYHAHFEDFVNLTMEAHLNSFCAHFITFGLINKLIEPDARELNPSSRKGVTLGSLAQKWCERGIISADLLTAKPKARA